MGGVKRFALLVFFLVGPALLAYAGLSGEMSVQVREGQVRESPAFLARIVARLPYGEPVSIQAEQGGWARVSALQNQAQGWLHASALSSEKLRLQAGDGSVQTGASGSEVALAGKGFDQNVENEFRQQNPDLEYHWIDQMELIRIDPAEIQGFLEQGGIVASAGGQSP